MPQPGDAEDRDAMSRSAPAPSITLITAEAQREKKSGAERASERHNRVQRGHEGPPASS